MDRSAGLPAQSATRVRIGSLAILTHGFQGPPTYYYIAYVIDLLRSQGRRVLLHQGLGDPPPADAALLHLDLTDYPDPYRDLARRYPLALNAVPASLGKRVVSRNLVGRDDAYDGPVIVKTDLNAGGLPEFRLAQADRAPAMRLWHALRQRLGAGPDPRYRVYPRRSAVPARIWQDPRLVVERLLLDRALVGGRFLNGIRQWFCFGQSGVVLTYRGPQVCLRYEGTTHITLGEDEVPDSIRRRRADLGIDYGKLDFVVTDGEAHLLDVNRTPYLGPPPWSATTDRIGRVLAAGLDSYA